MTGFKGVGGRDDCSLLTPSVCICCMQVHAGFGSAWLHSGFNTKVLARLRQLDSGPTPLRFWITGKWRGCGVRW